MVGSFIGFLDFVWFEVCYYCMLNDYFYMERCGSIIIFIWFDFTSFRRRVRFLNVFRWNIRLVDVSSFFFFWRCR